ncbi:MAG: class II aldolase/adducin family protein [bacterium]|nr:class II aldolase/adducin family protein [bacterium]
MIDEGAIKFQTAHRQRPLEARRFGELTCRLIAWREILAKTRLVGQDPSLYGGFGYGNVSGRVGPPSAPRKRRAFLITGTQTSGKPSVSLAEFCVVEGCDYLANRVESYGVILPSSESMTHGAIYDLAPHIRFVYHAHSPTIWRRAGRLRIPTTDERIAYGTPEMASEVERLWAGSSLPATQILAMGGHEDGIMVFGRSAEEAGQVMLRYLARAYEAVCTEAAGGICAF